MKKSKNSQDTKKSGYSPDLFGADSKICLKNGIVEVTGEMKDDWVKFLLNPGQEMCLELDKNNAVVSFGLIVPDPTEKPKKRLSERLGELGAPNRSEVAAAVTLCLHWERHGIETDAVCHIDTDEPVEAYLRDRDVWDNFSRMGKRIYDKADGFCPAKIISASGAYIYRNENGTMEETAAYLDKLMGGSEDPLLRKLRIRLGVSLEKANSKTTPAEVGVIIITGFRKFRRRLRSC